MYQRSHRYSRLLSATAALLLLFASCRRDNASLLQPISKKNALNTISSTPDTVWKLSALTFSYGDIPDFPGVKNTYNSSGKLTAMALNGDFNSPYSPWNFLVSYNGNYIYFYSTLTEDTTLTVRLDSIGRPSDFTCLHTNSQWINSLQIGHIVYYEPNNTILSINRTIDGVTNNISFWQLQDYGPYVRFSNGLSLNYLLPSIPVDTIETLHAYYEEMNSPDEWPLRIMQFSGILPYNPKVRIMGQIYANSEFIYNFPFTNHVIDYGKKLISYVHGSTVYTLKWQAFPQ